MKAVRSLVNPSNRKFIHLSSGEGCYVESLFGFPGFQVATEKSVFWKLNEQRRINPGCFLVYRGNYIYCPVIYGDYNKPLYGDPRVFQWKTFQVLGATAFGGPPVHLSMFRSRFVEKQRSDKTFETKQWKPWKLRNCSFVSISVMCSSAAFLHFFFDLCDTFVRYQWLSSERFAELFAMANCLPGPSSTQACGANPSKCGLESRVVVNDALIRHAAISFSQHFLSQFLQVAFAIGITQGGGHRLEHTHMAAFPVTCEAE